jgi:hypothetical protein
MERYTASIFKNNVLTNKGYFESEVERAEWLSKHIAKNTFGLPERPELALNEETGEMEPTGVILPAEYTIQINDITAQVEQENINQEARQFLSSTDWKVLRHNDQVALGVTTSLTQEEFQLLLNERQLARQRVV